MVRDRITRAVGLGHYPQLCFKLGVKADDGPIEVADGGIVDWTHSLLASNKERLNSSIDSLRTYV